MKLLITGGCGFLGSNLSAHAITNGMDLVIFDDLSRHGSKENLKWLRTKGDFDFIKGDIRDANKIDTVIRSLKPDALIHLAGQVAMTTSISDPRKDFEINALGSLNVLEAVRKHSPFTTVIYSSTNKVYGDFEWVKFKETDTRFYSPDFPKGFPETIPLDFHSPYGCSKGCADQYMLDYHRIFGLKTVVFRHSSMYGGRQFSTYDQGWIGWFCKMAVDQKNKRLKKPFTISGTGKQVRDVLYCDDMVALYFSAIEHIDKICGQAFNVGGGVKNSLSLLELFEILNKELKVKMRYKKLPWRCSDQKVFIADITKISKLCKWAPKVSKLEGIRKMLDWTQNNAGD